MNLDSWNSRQFITEDTHQYLSEDVIEESISKTLKPVMNKMKKLNIGLPYRDARIFFYNFLKEKHPELVPDMGKKKPSAKDVNALVGQIAIDSPEKFEKFGEEFDAYATENVPGTDEDRVSQFLRVAMILRTGKGVRPKKDEGYKKKEYSGLTAQEIKKTTMDAVKAAPVDKGEDADIQDEKLLLKASLAKVLNQMAQTEDIDPKIIANITNVGGKIDTVAKFKKFLDYMHQYEEYHVAEEYLKGMLEVIEKSLADMGGAEGEEELDDFLTHEHPEENMPPEYDIDNDDIESIIGGKFPKSKVKKVTTVEYEDEIDPKKADLDKDGEVSEYENARAEAAFGDDDDDEEDDNDQYAPEEAPADDQMGEMEPLDDEEEEDEQFNVSSYIQLKRGDERKEEEEQSALSPQEVARRMQDQRRAELQNFYRQERLNRHGY